MTFFFQSNPINININIYFFLTQSVCIENVNDLGKRNWYFHNSFATH